MKSDYLSWYKQNEDFFAILFCEDSLIFNHLHDIIKVLNHISKLDKVDNDLDIIYDTGFSYIYNKVRDIKYYLETYFQNNLQKFLKYETLINYSLYLDDLCDTLIEQKQFNGEIKEGISEINKEIDEIIKTQKKFEPEIINRYDMIVQSLIPPTQHLTIPEIFHRVAEELQL